MTDAFEAARTLVGREVHVSDWLPITQERVNRFADATGDHQWIHTDPERAAAESPFGGAIAHGFLLLSLYPALRDLVDPERPAYPGTRAVLNYGSNRCRFTAPVQVGQRVRARIQVQSVEPAGGGFQVVEEFRLEAEGSERPACVAEVILRCLT